MKKLIMTTVAAFGFAVCAKADVLNSTGFEGYGSNPFRVNTSDSGSPDSGTQYWTGTGDFEQTVLKTYGEDVVKPTNLPDDFETAGDYFLSVDTGSDVMYRKAGSDAGSVDLTQGAVFFDANVKFTASETDVVPSEGDKLLVWLKGDDTTTNLVVTAGLYNDLTGEYDPTNFTVGENGDYAADTWYRLTVKAAVDDNKFTYFNVYIDGEPVVATDKTTDFYSLVQTGVNKYVIAEAGFQGTGALDNVVWTTTDPFPAEATYTLAVTFVDEEAAITSITVNGATVEIEDVEQGLEIPFLATTETLEISVDLMDNYAIEGWDSLTKTINVAEAVDEDGKIELTITVVAAEEPGETTNLATAELSLDKDSVKEGEAAPTVTVTVDDKPLTEGTDYTVGTDYVAGTSKAGTYTITVTAVANSGYTGSKTITFTVTAEEVVPETGTAPAGGSATVKAADADAAVAAVTVQGVDGKVYDASQKYYTKTAVATETAGVFEVTVTLNADALDADVDAAVEAALEAVEAGATSVALPAGFYYKIESGNTLPIATTATGTTDGSEIEVEGLSAEAGFYKVSLDVAPIK